ncbi:MAG: DUF4340 domain-containing protein [Pseudomonadota bacterium]
MKWYRFLIMFVVFIVLFAFAHFALKDKEEADVKKAASNKVFAENISSSVEIIISSQKWGKLSFLRNAENNWQISSPIEYEADNEIINNIIDTSIKLEINKDLGKHEDISSFGLNESGVELTFRLSGSEKIYVLKIGDESPDKTSLYAKRNDEDRILMIPTSIKTYLDKDLSGFREKSIHKIKQEDITALDITNENNSFKFELSDNTWKLLKPLAITANETSINNLLNAIASTKAKDFPSNSSENLSKYGLEKPKIVTSLKLSDNRDIETLLSYKEVQGIIKYYLKTNQKPNVFEIDEATFNKLNIKFADIIDKKMLDLKQEDITKLALKKAAKKEVLELIKIENSWKLSGDDNFAVSTDELTTILSQLSNLLFDNIFTEKNAKLKYFASKEEFNISVYKNTSENAQTLYFSQLYEDDNVKFRYLYKDNSEFVYKIKEPKINSLNFDKDKIHMKKAFSIKKWKFDKIILACNDIKTTYFKKASGDKIIWVKDNNGKETQKPEEIDEFKNNLSKIEAVSFVQDGSKESFGLASESCKIEAFDKDGLKEVIVIGDKKGNQRYCKRLNDNEIWLFDDTIYDKIINSTKGK